MFTNLYVYYSWKHSLICDSEYKILARDARDKLNICEPYIFMSFELV